MHVHPHNGLAITCGAQRRQVHRRVMRHCRAFRSATGHSTHEVGAPAIARLSSRPLVKTTGVWEVGPEREPGAPSPEVAGI